MNCGAQTDVRNADGKIPVEVATTTEAKQILGVETGGSGEHAAAAVPGSSFIPNYLQHPNINGKVDLKKVKQGDVTSEIALSRNESSSGTTLGTRIFKIRIAGFEDPDFIEIDVPESNLNLNDLKEIMCNELKVEKQAVIERVRKLPNTRLRRDVEVTRLVDYAELGLVLLNSDPS